MSKDLIRERRRRAIIGINPLIAPPAPQANPRHTALAHLAAARGIRPAISITLTNAAAILASMKGGAQ